MGRKYVVARSFDRALDFARDKRWVHGDWSYVNSEGGNLHKLEGTAPLPSEILVVDTPDSRTRAMINNRTDVGLATRVLGTKLPGDFNAEVVEINMSMLNAWAHRMRVVQSALWDMGYKHLAAETELVVDQMKKKLMP